MLDDGINAYFHKDCNKKECNDKKKICHNGKRFVIIKKICDNKKINHNKKRLIIMKKICDKSSISIEVIRAVCS